MMGLFTLFVSGQGAITTGTTQTPLEEVVRLAGWLAIIASGVTYTALSVYNAIRGKDYEQLKEALSNYKELAESRKAQIFEKDATAARINAELLRLEVENERLAEKVLRQ